MAKAKKKAEEMTDERKTVSVLRLVFEFYNVDGEGYFATLAHSASVEIFGAERSDVFIKREDGEIDVVEELKGKIYPVIDYEKWHDETDYDVVRIHSEERPENWFENSWESENEDGE